MDEKFQKFWAGLSEGQRKLRVEQSFKILRHVSRIQMAMLRKFINEDPQPKTSRHWYFVRILESFWENGDFALSLGKRRYPSYAVYPVRTMMEKLLKLLWFTKQDDKTQDKIFIKESMLACLDFYEMEKLEGGSGWLFENYYNELNRENAFPVISLASRSKLKVFPDYRSLCETVGPKHLKFTYSHYRYLSGFPHGNIVSIVMKDGGAKEEYRRVIMLMSVLCVEILRLTDYHLNNKTTRLVEDEIKRSRGVVMRGMEKC